MGFTLIVLGCRGGPRGNDLSSYLLLPDGQTKFLSLDAGTVFEALEETAKEGVFDDLGVLVPGRDCSYAEFMEKHMGQYFISHAHLDHFAGLVFSSVFDSQTKIYGNKKTIRYLRKHIFNDSIWPDFSNMGKKNLHYASLRYQKEKRVGLDVTVKAFRLNHPNDYESTAFLFETNEESFIYFGDTASDRNEKVKRLNTIWNGIAPKVKERTLKGIIIECSFSRSQPYSRLYGHLNSQLFIQEFRQLAHIVDPGNPKCLAGLKVVVTHIKEDPNGGDHARYMIQKELDEENDLGLELIYPHRGQKILFP